MIVITAFVVDLIISQCLPAILLFLRGFLEEADVNLFVAAGVNRVFIKPVQVDELLALLLREVHHRWRGKYGLYTNGTHE